MGSIEQLKPGHAKPSKNRTCKHKHAKTMALGNDYRVFAGLSIVNTVKKNRSTAERSEAVAEMKRSSDSRGCEQGSSSNKKKIIQQLMGTLDEKKAFVEKHGKTMVITIHFEVDITPKNARGENKSSFDIVSTRFFQYKRHLWW